MKKIIMLAMAIVLVLGVAVLGISAADLPVFDVSDRTETNAAWEYDATTKMLTVKDDMVLTGSSQEDIVICITEDVEITLRNLTAQNKAASCNCSVGSDVYYDFICDIYHDSEHYDVVLILEGENTVTTNDGEYFNYICGDLVIKGEGTLKTNGIIYAEGNLNIEIGRIDCEEYIEVLNKFTLSGGTVTTNAVNSNDIEISGGELNVKETIMWGDGFIESIKISGGKVKAGVLAVMNANQTGGTVELGGYVEDDIETWGLLTETYKISGGCLKSKAVTPPEDWGEDVPETVSVLVLGGDGIVITEPAVLIAGEIVEEDGAVLVEGDLHICEAFDITVKAENGKVEAPKSAYVGEKVEFKATANEGYELKGITVNGQKVEGTSFTMPAQDVEIEATFEKKPSAQAPVDNDEIKEESEPEKEQIKNPPTSDMNITFAVALTMVAAVATISIKKIKSMQ